MTATVYDIEAVIRRLNRLDETVTAYARGVIDPEDRSPVMQRDATIRAMQAQVREEVYAIVKILRAAQ